MNIDFYRLQNALRDAVLMILIIAAGCAGILGLLFGAVWLFGHPAGIGVAFILIMFGMFTWISY
jgi:hypothetical protein